MNRENAAQTLAQAKRLQKKTYSLIHTFWFPLIFWGSITLLSGLCVAIAGIKSTGIFWPIAGTLGFLVMAGYFSKREKSIGIKAPAWPYITLAIALMISAGLASSVGSDYSKEIGSWLVVSIAYLGFARLARSWYLAGLAFALGVLAAIVGLGTGESYIPLSITYGLSFIVAGLVARNIEKRHG